MLTADTITDEQIRELRDQAIAGRQSTIAKLCNDALGVSISPREKTPVDEARDACAEIINNKQAGAVDYSVKVDALLKHARDFTTKDFLDLAMAALDQLGLSVEDQRFVYRYIRDLDCAPDGGPHPWDVETLGVHSVDRDLGPVER